MDGRRDMHWLDAVMWTLIGIVVMVVLMAGLGALMTGCATTQQVTPGATSTGKTPEEPKKPAFALRASRQMAFPGVPILLTAALDGGEEVEEYYCPLIEWTWANGTHSREGGDCPEFDKREDYPRRWTRWVALTVPGEYKVEVRWEKPEGKVIGMRDIVLTGLGGEGGGGEER